MEHRKVEVDDVSLVNVHINISRGLLIRSRLNPITKDKPIRPSTLIIGPANHCLDEIKSGGDFFYQASDKRI